MTHLMQTPVQSVEKVRYDRGLTPAKEMTASPTEGVVDPIDSLRETTSSDERSKGEASRVPEEEPTRTPLLKVNER